MQSQPRKTALSPGRTVPTAPPRRRQNKEPGHSCPDAPPQGSGKIRGRDIPVPTAPEGRGGRRFSSASSRFRGGYDKDDFQADLLALKTAYKAYTSAEVALGLARGKRNETQELICPVLRQYRQRIPSEFAEGSAILATLPRLSPLPGSTPDAVELSGSYDAAEQKSDLAWSEVTDESVTELELRATAGPEYDPEDETILATIAPSAPRVWTGSFGLLVPGSAASFKLYPITAEGNERGSNAVAVTRPA